MLTAVIVSSEVRSFDISAKKFNYTPNVIRVSKGDTVKIRLVSQDVHHGFFLDGYEVQTSALPGEDGFAEFVANKTGRFSFRCSVTCGDFHPYMIGYLYVEPNSRFYFGSGIVILLGLGSLILTLGRRKPLSQFKLFGIVPFEWKYDLTKIKLIKTVLKNRWFPLIIIIINLFVFIVIMLAGFVGGFGSGSYNFAVMIIWILWWVVLMLFLVPFIGRAWCMVCPFPLFGEWIQRRRLFEVKGPANGGLNKEFPKKLKNLWPLVLLFWISTWFSGFFTVRPFATFVFIGVIILLAVIVEVIFRRRAFCIAVCPVSGFQGLYANASAMEIRSKDPEVCNRIKPGREYSFKDGIPACRLACPAGVDSSSYIMLIAKGKFERAHEVITETMPFAGTCGRICTAPCESACVRNKVDQPIGIRALKRFVADFTGYEKNSAGKFTALHPEKVAVIGAGPAGLTCAYYLAKKGYETTVYESMPVSGGMLKVGIPDFKLPKDVLAKEIELVKNAGVKILTNTTVGREISFESLNKNFQAVFIGIGAVEGKKLKIDGEDLDGVHSAIDVLRKTHLGEKVALGRKVVIVGGGNTAIDAARVSLRLGAEEVAIAYRRSRSEMPALPEEISHAEEEGVKFYFQTAPKKVTGRDGKAVSLECVKTEMKESDESGRPRAVEVKGSEFSISADTVLIAAGQYSDVKFLPPEMTLSNSGTIITDTNTRMTSVKGVFAGGDVVSGPYVFVNAVADGRKAAINIERYLRGEEMTPVSLHPDDKQVDDWMLDSTNNKERVPLNYLPVDRRKRNFEEVEFVYENEKAVEEANRCLACGYCANCYRGNEKGYGCPWMELPFDMNRNTYCGMCMECIKTCPYDNMAMNVRPFGVNLLTDRRRSDDAFGRRGLDEAFKALTMIGIMFSFFIAMQGPFGHIKDNVRGTTLPGYLSYILESGLTDFLLIPGVFFVFAFLSKLASGAREVGLKTVFVNFSYILVPVGLAVWASFSFGIIFPNGSYLLHVISDPFAWGWNLFGTAHFPWTPFFTDAMPYVQIGVIIVGLLFALDFGFKFSLKTFGDLNRAKRGWAPILAFLVLSHIMFLWLFVG